MAATAALKRIDSTRRNFKRIVAVTVATTYSGSGTTGEVVDMTAMTNPNNLERAKLCRVIPDLSRIRVLNTPAGWVTVLTLGTTLAAQFGLRFFQSDDAVDPLDELADGAYPVSLEGQVIYVEIAEQN